MFVHVWDFMLVLEGVKRLDGQKMNLHMVSFVRQEITEFSDIIVISIGLFLHNAIYGSK